MNAKRSSWLWSEDIGNSAGLLISTDGASSVSLAQATKWIRVGANANPSQQMEAPGVKPKFLHLKCSTGSQVPCVTTHQHRYRELNKRLKKYPIAAAMPSDVTGFSRTYPRASSISWACISFSCSPFEPNVPAALANLSTAWCAPEAMRSTAGRAASDALVIALWALAVA